MKYALLTGLAALVLAFGQPASADELADGVATVPGGIEDVRIGGTWEGDGKSGAYRVLIARTGGDTVTARLFVQWIAYQEDGSATVDNTIEIKELADLKVDIVNYQSESDRDGLSIYIETLGTGESEDTSYELHVISPTEYRFGPASN
jgi:hypothetical protein